MAREIPQLKHFEGSWIVVRMCTGEPVREIFKNTKAAELLSDLKPEFVAVPIQTYLSKVENGVYYAS